MDAFVDTETEHKYHHKRSKEIRMRYRRGKNGSSCLCVCGLTESMGDEFHFKGCALRWAPLNNGQLQHPLPQQISLRNPSVPKILFYSILSVHELDFIPLFFSRILC
ncbi:hypothetical protein AVEN_263763-1 [Araneus ventricosus]|uniref:Uncharacterized protein n=1 Tax=Araneus ventricosus TaxID=182803 RepID=A0A4Y2AU49_ARAVE|nr:hypothetical protein AVEN_263763-1 [Araneus ventricosus]